MISTFYFSIHVNDKRDLSNNQITVLPPGVFSNLSRLATLIVSYNKLQCVQSRAFSGKCQDNSFQILTGTYAAAFLCVFV